MILQPNYYDKFKCIADKCKDNCCIGWEIDIDEITFNKYMNIGGNLGNRLKDEITTENGVHCFKLKENERCPFLNENNLCDIICESGEENLCQICNDHPRYINNYGDITERGLGLACEEACRIILTQNSPAYLIDSESKVKYTPVVPDNPYLEYLYKVRNIIVDILQNKHYTINRRISYVIELCRFIQNECDSEKSDDQLLSSLDDVKKYTQKLFEDYEKNQIISDKEHRMNVIREILTDYTELEILDPEWKVLLDNTINNIENGTSINSADNDSCIYENMLVYLTHRYFLESYYDNMFIEKAIFLFTTYIVVRNISVYAYDNSYTDDIIDIIHSYSKEIEYSDLNIETLYSKHFCTPTYSQNNIYTVLSE